MSIAEVIPVPAEVQQRAWEAALAVLTDHVHRLARTQRMAIARIVGLEPEDLTWADTKLALEFHSAFVERRV